MPYFLNVNSKSHANFEYRVRQMFGKIKKKSRGVEMKAFSRLPSRTTNISKLKNHVQDNTNKDF